MRRAGALLFGDGLRWEGIETAGHLDPLLFDEVVARSRLADAARHHDAFREGYVRELSIELKTNGRDAIALPGVHDALKHLRERAVTRGDVALGLLTGNYGAAVPIKLAAVGIDPAWFPITAFGDEGPTRAALVALALAKYRRRTGRAIESRRVVVIGDTPRDVACARANGCMAFAVATGKHTVDELRESGADVVVPDLTDPLPLFDLVAGARPSERLE